MTAQHLGFMLALFVSLPGHAVTFLSFDAESLALGGAGSVTGIGGYKPFLSPALPARPSTSSTAATYLSARVIDRQRFIRTLEEIQEADENLALNQRLRAARSAFRGGQLDSAQLRELGGTAGLVLEQYQASQICHSRLSAKD